MTKAKTTFMVVTGASVGVVRDGKRKTLTPGQGENFTDEEIATRNFRHGMPILSMIPCCKASSGVKNQSA